MNFTINSNIARQKLLFLYTQNYIRKTKCPTNLRTLSLPLNPYFYDRISKKFIKLYLQISGLQAYFLPPGQSFDREAAADELDKDITHTFQGLAQREDSTFLICFHERNLSIFLIKSRP